MKSNRIISAIFLVFLGGNSFAESLEVDYKPFYDTTFGVNYHQSWITAKPEWDKLLIKTQPGFSFYFGWRFHSNFSVDLGYEWSANKPLTTVIANGNTFLGIQNTTGVAMPLTGKVRFKTGHLDLNYFFPLLNLDTLAPEGILTVGVGATKPGVKITGPEDSFTEPFLALKGRSKAVYRVGFGMQTLLVEDIGARIIGRYENTSILRLRGSPIAESQTTKFIFRNGVSLSVGLFMKF